MVYPIKIKSAEDATKVSNVIAQTGENIFIHCGNIILDPRSVLGLLLLVGKDALLVGPDHMNPDKFSRLINKLGTAV